MRLKNETANRSMPLELLIQKQIDQRTFGRIFRLDVQLDNRRVIVHGSAPSYYAKQLALEAVLPLIESAGLDGVDLDIDVAPSLPRMFSRAAAR